MPSEPAAMPDVGKLSLWAALGLALTFIAGIIRWGVIQTLIVIAFVGMLLVSALINKPRNITGPTGATWLALTLVSLSPVAFGLLIFVITPTYYRPLYESAQGATVLVGFGVVVVVASAAAQLAIRAFRRGHSLTGAALSSITAICVLSAFLFVLLGPPVAILLRPES